MNSESAKELLKLRNSALVCRHMAIGRVCDLAFLTSSGGKFYKFFMRVALAVPPLTMKNRHVRLFSHVRLIGRIG